MNKSCMSSFMNISGLSLDDIVGGNIIVAADDIRGSLTFIMKPYTLKLKR